MSTSLNACPICEFKIENSTAPCPQCGYDLEEDFWASRREREQMRQQARQAWQEKHAQEMPTAELPTPSEQVEFISIMTMLSEEHTPEKQQPMSSPPPLKVKKPQIGHEQRYLDLGDGTVIDTVTGLQWMRCALGQTWRDDTCVGMVSRYTWKKAFEFAEDLNAQGGFAGHQDWRIPTIDELKTLILCTSGQPKTWNNIAKLCQGNYKKPTICQESFPNTLKSLLSAYFWSASSIAYSSVSVWIVSFNHGRAHYDFKDNVHAVRFVRGGQ